MCDLCNLPVNPQNVVNHNGRGLRCKGCWRAVNDSELGIDPVKVETEEAEVEPKPVEPKPKARTRKAN